MGDLTDQKEVKQRAEEILEFFNQNGDDITIAAYSGIRIAESEGDDEGREMSLGEIVGEKPIDAPYGFCGAKDFAWKPISTEDFE